MEAATVAPAERTAVLAFVDTVLIQDDMILKELGSNLLFLPLLFFIFIFFLIFFITSLIFFSLNRSQPPPTQRKPPNLLHRFGVLLQLTRLLPQWPTNQPRRVRSSDFRSPEEWQRRHKNTQDLPIFRFQFPCAVLAFDYKQNAFLYCFWNRRPFIFPRDPSLWFCLRRRQNQKIYKKIKMYFFYFFTSFYLSIFKINNNQKTKIKRISKINK